MHAERAGAAASLATRLRAHLAATNRQYPQAWEQMAGFRAAKGSPDLGDWPAWCWVPLAGAKAVASEGRDELVRERSADVGRIGALAAWRQTQGIYVLDETLLEALWQTDLTGEIPVDVLYRLPEWCVYVATPARARLAILQPRPAASSVSACRVSRPCGSRLPDWTPIRAIRSCRS